MKDRIPTIPGRVLIHPENGEPDFYAILSMADDPVQLGTDLNKLNLLSDKTSAKLGLPDTPDPTIDAALSLLSKKTSTVIGTYTGDDAQDRNISLGFHPICVIVFSKFGTPYYYYDDSTKALYYCGGFVTRSTPNRTISENVETMKITDDGFQVHKKSIHGSFHNEAIFLNVSGQSYNYVAFMEVPT